MADERKSEIRSDVLPEGLTFVGEGRFGCDVTIVDAQDVPWVTVHVGGHGDPAEWRTSIIQRIALALGINE